MRRKNRYVERCCGKRSKTRRILSYCMKNPSDKYPIVYVEWKDAFSCGDWHDEEELFGKHWTEKEMETHEIGWLLKKDERKILISSQYQPNNDKWGNTTLIPTTWATIKELAPPKKK